MWSARDQESAREFREFCATEERIERERIERPIREAESALAKTATEYYTLLREIALSEPIEPYDPEAFNGIPRVTDESKISEKKVHEAARAFKQAEPRYYHSPEAYQVLTDFILRNKLNPEFQQSWQKAFDILSYLALLEAPEPQPEMPTIEAQPEPEPPKVDDEFMRGFDGIYYTKAQVWRMGSEEFKRKFGLYGDNLPKWSNVLL